MTKLLASLMTKSYLLEMMLGYLVQFEFLSRQKTPNILITTSRFNSTIVEYAMNKEFTSISYPHQSQGTRCFTYHGFT
ncbi:hypothetical protein L6164_021309 [Bauhinia variegata]|uniref:Uncharacterized protein n=1 Tax=Bauhinia variegata TaxID=167791 RepID=A0ACB9MY31_BAUVA|nr:hypothetical protein L6164_021309 [Bauhinia variegata]